MDKSKLKVRKHGATFPATLRATVVDVESSSTLKHCTQQIASSDLTRPQSSLSARRGIRARGIDEERDTRGRGQREE